MTFRWLTRFLDFPASSFDTGVAFWREVTGSALSPFRGAAGEFATLLPPDGDAYLRVQRIADGSGGCHLDLHLDPAAGTVDQAADRAVALGAVVRHASEGLVIMGSPGGFTFCLVRWHGESTVPRPVVLDAGGPSRADQLCLDIPPDAFEREYAFWAALTGWGPRPRTGEFARLDQPAQIPLRLLFHHDDRPHRAPVLPDRARTGDRHPPEPAHDRAAAHRANRTRPRRAQPAGS